MSKKYPGGYLTKTPPTVSTTSAQGIWTLEQAEYYQNAGLWPVPPDPYFNQVSLLLHGDGTNGAQNNTFLDSSTNNFTITRTGNVAQGTFSPFSLADGQWSNYFDGSGDYLSTSSIGAISGDFTIEFWAYKSANSPAGYDAVCSAKTGTTIEWLVELSASRGFLIYEKSTGFCRNTTTTGINDSAWHHWAVCRSGSNWYLFRDGVSLTLAINNIGTATLGAGTSFLVGAVGGGFTFPFNGTISNFRVVKGTALYTSNFTPPTSSLTAITGTTVLTCQSNRFIDNSSNNFTITPAGDTKVTAFSPFAPSAAYSASTNGGSAYFDGSGDYLSSSLITISGDFTIEGYFYYTSIGETIPLSSTSGNVQIFRLNKDGNPGAIFVYPDAGWFQITTNIFKINAWNHLALSRTGSTAYLFLNGVLLGTNASASNSFTLSSYGAYQANSFWYTGYISNLRVVNGTALYTANFTPPTAPLTAITNTQLLLNCVNAGIYDNAAKNDIETVGNAQISTSIKKYGTGSIFLNNSAYPAAGGDFLTCLAPNDLYNFGTGDFTIEMLINPTGLSGGNYNSIFAFTPTHVNLGLYILYGKLDLWVGGGQVASGTATISTGTWTHVAISRSGTLLKMFVNGVQDASITNATNISGNTGVRLGQDLFDSGNVAFYGYIDDLRITKGIARYTANFTPPNGPFPNV